MAIIEVQRYLEADFAPRESNPLEWWNENQFMFKYLPILVRQKLCNLATSSLGSMQKSKKGGGPVNGQPSTHEMDRRAIRATRSYLSRTNFPVRFLYPSAIPRPSPKARPAGLAQNPPKPKTLTPRPVPKTPRTQKSRCLSKPKKPLPPTPFPKEGFKTPRPMLDVALYPSYIHTTSEERRCINAVGRARAPLTKWLKENESFNYLDENYLKLIERQYEAEEDLFAIQRGLKAPTRREAWINVWVPKRRVVQTRKSRARDTADLPTVKKPKTEKVYLSQYQKVKAERCLEIAQTKLSTLVNAQFAARTFDPECPEYLAIVQKIADLQQQVDEFDASYVKDEDWVKVPVDVKRIGRP
nr:unnamed protein product [Callosobruchus chinensis]